MASASRSPARKSTEPNFSGPFQDPFSQFLNEELKPGDGLSPSKWTKPARGPRLSPPTPEGAPQANRPLGRLRNMKRPATKRLAAWVFVAAVIGTSAMLAQGQRSWFKAKDPGPRPNPASAIPVPVAGLNGNEAALFNESLLRVSELEGSCDTCAQQPQNTLPIDPDPNNPFSPPSLGNAGG